MGKKAPKKAYVVTIGRNPGIYRTWEECKKQVDGFSGQRQRGFETVKEAEDYWEKHLQESKSSLGDGRNLKIEPLISRHQNLQGECTIRFTLYYFNMIRAPY
jgi:viroplasmin and RNaseH domain-containing protein